MPKSQEIPSSETIPTEARTPRRRRGLTKAQIRRACEGAAAAGLNVSLVKIEGDRLSIFTGEPTPSPDPDGNEWGEVLDD